MDFWFRCSIRGTTTRVESPEIAHPASESRSLWRRTLPLSRRRRARKCKFTSCSRTLAEHRTQIIDISSSKLIRKHSLQELINLFVGERRQLRSDRDRNKKKCGLASLKLTSWTNGLASLDKLAWATILTQEVTLAATTKLAMTTPARLTSPVPPSDRESKTGALRLRTRGSLHSKRSCSSNRAWCRCGEEAIPSYLNNRCPTLTSPHCRRATIITRPWKIRAQP